MALRGFCIWTLQLLSLSCQIVSLTGVGALREVEVPIIDQSSCQSMYHILSSDLVTVDVLSDMICAGYMEGGKDSCQVCYYYYAGDALTSYHLNNIIFSLSGGLWRASGLSCWQWDVDSGRSCEFWTWVCSEEPTRYLLQSLKLCEPHPHHSSRSSLFWSCLEEWKSNNSGSRPLYCISSLLEIVDAMYKLYTVLHF